MNATLLLQLFSPPDDPALLAYGIYDPWLVVLSVAVASFASWMGLQIAGQAAAATTRSLRTIALLTGSLALGSGVWAMHFIGMLAFNLCTRVDYDPAITIWSMLPSVAASFVALSLIGRKRIRFWPLLIGGVLVGAGIGAMHYTGMAAMRMSLALRYDPLMFGLSIVVAVVLATLALWVRFGLRNFSKRLSEGRCLLISGVVMGCAIAGMHYTGMAAARFVGSVQPDVNAGIANAAFVALAVSLMTAVFTIFVVWANGLLRYREMFRHLSQSESWMRAMLATAVDGVITVDADGKIHEFNAAAERIFGWARAEIVGHSITTLIADVEQSSQDGILGYLSSRGTAPAGHSSEVLGRRKDRTVFPIRRALGHARLADQDRFVCFVTDISERKSMEQALRDSEQQFRSLIGNIPGISYRCLMTDSRTMVFISDAVEHVSGHAAADFLGADPLRLYAGLIHPHDRDRVMAEIDTAVRADHPFVIEYRLLHRDGSTRWVWENGSAVRDEQGHVKWLDGVILDISGRRQMEEDLREAKEHAEQAAAARAAFLANMSHEIRTPMNSILGFTDVLLQGELSPEQRRHLDIVRNAGRSLLRLLNEVLDTVKLDKGAMELELADFDLLGLIDELSSTLGIHARSKGLFLDIRYHENLPRHIHGDALRIRQVLTNLLGNAVKFTEAGSVTISADVQDGQLHIAVRDTGIGIAADRLDAIFFPFTQADASMSRRFGGTGLGTTISKQLVELMGGRIWAESILGQGSTFHVLLPLVAARQSQQPQQQRVPITLPPLHILAADDVPQNLELLALLLGKQGHSVITANNGAVAVQLAAEKRFDLILMDVQMPDMDGLEATRRIRRAETRNDRSRAPVIAMTASVLEADREATRQAGMDGFATKPIDLFALTQEVARVLGLTASINSPAGTHAAGAQVLDSARGVQRWAGERDAYHRALRRFAAEHGEAPAVLSGFVDGQAHPAAQALAHKIRGAAANLGLEQLADVLNRLESASREKDAAALPMMLDEVSERMAMTLQAIETEAGQVLNAAPLSAPPFDAQGVQALGATLMQSLRRGAFDDAALAQLTSLLAGHAEPEAIHALQRASDDFDFVLAQTRLEALLAGCSQALDQEIPR